MYVRGLDNDILSYYSLLHTCVFFLGGRARCVSEGLEHIMVYTLLNA